MQLVVTKVKKDIVVGERILVVDINISEENAVLHLCMSSTPRMHPGHLPQAMPQLAYEESLSRAIFLPYEPAQSTFYSTRVHPGQLQGLLVNISATMGILIVLQII
jgi:hypothetical protein